MLDSQLQVGGFDLPALVVQRHQRGGWPGVGVGQGGGQPVGPAGAAGAGGDGDLGADDAHLDPAKHRQPGSVLKATQQRQLAVALAASQQVGVGGGDAAGQGAGGEVAVQQHQHPGVQAAQQPLAHGGLPAAGGAEGDLDQAAGAAGDQGDQAQQRVARAAVVAGVGGEAPKVRGGVSDAEGGAVDGAHQQPTNPHPGRGRHRCRTAQQVKQCPQRRRAQAAAGLGERRGGRGRHPEAVQAGTPPLPDPDIAKLGEQAAGQQQVHHHPCGQVTDAGLGPAGLGQDRIDQLEGHLLGGFAQVPGGKATRRHRQGAVDDRPLHGGAPVGVVL
jgi:hypothetical protein